jgi:hypothetical protein
MSCSDYRVILVQLGGILIVVNSLAQTASNAVSFIGSSQVSLNLLSKPSNVSDLKSRMAARMVRSHTLIT